MQKEILESRKRSESRKRTCMFNDCKENAIKSHVLQKNGILREISENNHLIQLTITNPFELQQKGPFNFTRTGVNDAYTFKGFCREHDNKIFEPIESEAGLNVEDVRHQILLSYRGLCQEIRRKQISIEWLEDMLNIFPITQVHLLLTQIRGYKHGIENLSFFKNRFEDSLNKQDFSLYKFQTVKIPRIELCISVPLNIEFPDQVMRIPYITSFMNVFPIKDHSYIIAGYHKDFPCTWTRNFLLKAKNQQNVFKLLSDLIVLRLEFWSMSPQLFRKISAKDLEIYRQTFMDNLFNHKHNLQTDLNLFKKI